MHDHHLSYITILGNIYIYIHCLELTFNIHTFFFLVILCLFSYRFSDLALRLQFGWYHPWAQLLDKFFKNFFDLQMQLKYSKSFFFGQRTHPPKSMHKASISAHQCFKYICISCTKILINYRLNTF